MEGKRERVRKGEREKGKEERRKNRQLVSIL